MISAPVLIANIFSWQIIVVLIVIMLLFGSRLPDVMRSLGRSVTEFKKGINEPEDETGETAKKVEKP